MTNNSKMNVSKRKKMLLKTYTEFDGTSSSSGPSAVNYEDEGLHSQLVPFNQPPPISLVIQALIHQVCKHMEQDKEKRRLLYSAICSTLEQHKFLGLNITLDGLWPMKETFCNVLSKFFTQVHKNVSSQGLESCTSVSIHGAFDYVRTDVHHQDRYQQSFEEIETIARGGFGVVCKARNKVDDSIYAIKKIKFKYTNDVEFEKVLREVRSFAMLRHQNIVSYNHSWLETNIITESTVATDTDSESYSSDGEQQNTDNSSFRTGGSKDRAVSLVSNLSSGASVSDERNPSGHSNNLTSLLVDSLKTPASFKSSVVVNSEIHILHKNTVIDQKKQSRILETSETSSEWLNEMCIENRFDEFSVGEPLQKTFHDVEHDAENSYAECDFIYHEPDECGDCNQKLSSRRRRHSSGATCSTTDQGNETDISKKEPPHRRSYDRFNSLDLDHKTCTDLVPKMTNMRWDISSLGVMAILYIQMELCDQSLRDWLDERAEMPPNCCKPDMLIRKALKIFEQIVQGVEHIHSKFIIHRDLKPKNIFLCSNDTIKIGDFGLAALCTQTDNEDFFHTKCSCNHTQGLGTAPYSAPEQKKHGNYDKKVDIYSLGIILIEMLHCYHTRMEFFSTVDKITKGCVPTEFINTWPEEVVNLILRLVNKTPLDRPEAKEILSYLQGFKTAESLSKKENEAFEISELKAEVRDLKRQLLERDKEDKKNKAQIFSLETELSERDEKIKELQLELLYQKNHDSSF